MKFKAEETENNKSGLFLYLFAEKNFKAPFLFGPTKNDGLACAVNIVKEFGLAKTAIKSAKLIGYIKPKHTGNYQLKLSQNFADCQINLDDQWVVRNTDIKAQNLSADEWVPIEVSLQFDTALTIEQLTELKLVMVGADGTETALPQTNLLNPDFRNDRHKWLTAAEEDDEDIDTDDDAIPDVFEINGYTIAKKVAVKWSDKYEELGYTRFVSNPYLAHTVGDPYTDYEKAARDIDKSSDPVTFNPLVAACPSVKVVLENTILSPNKDYSRSVGSHSSTNYSATKSQNIGFNSGFSLMQGLSLGVSGSFGSSETTGQDWGQSEDNTEHFNSASAAYLNANVRYRNTGAGSIYKLAPTTNFVIDDDTIATLKAKENTLAEGLASGDNYPEGGHGIALNTMDDFSSHPITLNKAQFEYFMSNKGPLLLETTQSAGVYVYTDRYGQPQYGDEWTPFKKVMAKNAANIIIDSVTDVQERYIAAKDFEDPEDLTPVLTVKEALKLAFKNNITEEADGFLYYDDKLMEEPQTLRIVDEYTRKTMEKQIKATSGPFKDVKTFYDVKLFPKMALDIKIGLFFEEAYIGNSYYHTTNHGTQSYGQQVPDLGLGKTDCFAIEYYDYYRLTPKDQSMVTAGNYIFSYYVKNATKANQRLRITLTEKHDKYGGKAAAVYQQTVLASEDDWVRINVPFKIDEDYMIDDIYMSFFDEKAARSTQNIYYNYISVVRV